MNKNRFFLISMIAVSALLFMLRMTGIAAHIGVSVLGLAIMIPITLKTRKEWKIPALEIVMRAFYGVALITGIVILNIEGIVALEILHKVCCGLFAALLVALFVIKLVSKKKN